MIRPSLCILLFLSLITISGCSDKKASKADAGAKDASGDADVTADGGDDAGEDGAEADGMVEQDLSCGNGELDEFEECDDSNFSEWDGCTTLCEFTCQEDIDCDDLNICNGEETCKTDEHTCATGVAADDGTECGSGRSCISGICINDICGDGLVKDEECDDGDLVETNGCTTECKFSCDSKDPNRDCSDDECSASVACNDQKHICEGDPLPPKTPCDSGDGWCMNGICVPFNCGDGTEDLNEECDLGQDNGKPDSTCSITCKNVICGNGIIEEHEQCDDGNNAQFDGCDPECKAEITYRLSRMDVRKEAPPDFCFYPGNAFGDAFREKLVIKIAGVEIQEIDIIGSINNYLASNIAAGTTNSMIQLLAPADPSAQTKVEDVYQALYSAIPDPDTAWPSDPEGKSLLDFPFLIEPFFLNQDNSAKYTMHSRMLGSGLLISKEPANTTVRAPVGTFVMYNLTVRVVLDVKTLSTPTAPPEVIESVRAPEVFGKGDPNAEPYKTEGILCGALSEDSLKEPMVSFMASCCPDPDIRQEPYDSCEEDELPPDCETFLDVIQGGCNIFPTALGSCPDIGTGYEVQPIIFATMPDVDSDSDGVNDAYSVVIGAEGMRAKIVGIAEE